MHMRRENDKLKENMYRLLQPYFLFLLLIHEVVKIVDTFKRKMVGKIDSAKIT